MKHLSLTTILSLSLCIVSPAAVRAYDEEVEEAIEKGQEVFHSIPDPSTVTDSRVDCDINQHYSIHPYEDSSDVLSVLSETLQATHISFRSEWTRVDHEFPIDPKKELAHFYCGYNPDGAIVYMDIAREAGDGPFSAADISWAVYRRVVDDSIPGSKLDQNDYSNIKYLFHTDITSDNAWEVFEEFGEQEQVHTYMPGDDGFYAVMGLDNAKVTASLLTHHNIQAGRKRLESISIYATKRGRLNACFKLV